MVLHQSVELAAVTGQVSDRRFDMPECEKRESRRFFVEPRGAREL